MKPEATRTVFFLITDIFSSLFSFSSKAKKSLAKFSGRERRNPPSPFSHISFYTEDPPLAPPPFPPFFFPFFLLPRKPWKNREKSKMNQKLHFFCVSRARTGPDSTSTFSYQINPEQPPPAPPLVLCLKRRRLRLDHLHSHRCAVRDGLRGHRGRGHHRTSAGGRRGRGGAGALNKKDMIETLRHDKSKNVFSLQVI